MNYHEAIEAARFHGVRSMDTALRAHAFGLYQDPRREGPGADRYWPDPPPFVQALQRAGVRPRTAKKWAVRWLRTALPRSRRITGPALRTKSWRSK